MNGLKTSIAFAIVALLSLTGCNGSRIQEKTSDSTKLSQSQEHLISEGWYIPVKIIDASRDKCIRYVLVPENSSVSVQMIPQGRYYLKLAYGKDWMEYDNGDGTITGKFTKNESYDKSVDVFDFGKKNSSDNVSYVLHINVVNSKLENNFETQEISEDDFFL